MFWWHNRHALRLHLPLHLHSKFYTYNNTKALFYLYIYIYKVAQWLRRCATSRTVPGSIPGSITGFFRDIFPSDRTIAPSENEYQEQFLGKGGRCVTLTTSPPSPTECHEIWEPKPRGTLWATPGLLRDCFTSTFPQRPALS